MRKVINQDRVRAWEAVGGICSFGAGLLAALLGSLLTASGWILEAELHPWIHAAGTVLLIVAIPLILFAGFCLDWAEQGQKRHHRDEAQRGTAALAQIATVATILGVALLAPAALHAQQTIFNVPTTDVLDRGKVYGELDVPFKPNSDPGNVVPRFSSFVPRVVVGTGGRFEVGLNITGNINPGPDSTTLVPAIKYKAYDGGNNGWAIALGDNVFIPVRNKSYDIGNYVYAEASKTFSTKTRLTFGGYHFSDNVVAAGAQRAGGQFGFEQPITSKFGFAADWYTGKHSAGYFTPGVIFKPHPRVTGYAGYSLGNSNLRNGNHFFLLELGYNFN